MLFLLCACAAEPTAPSALPLLADNELDTSSSIAGLEFTDPNCWSLGVDDQRGPCLELREGCKYQPPHRSPLGLAVLRTPAVADFDLEVEARQTGREYPHRDLCIALAFTDADHFAYAHLASIGDANAHQVMLVDGADRRPVTLSRTKGVTWGDGWHHLRVQRRGHIVRVWFDEAQEPVLTGDVPLGAGCIGLGSFDDPGRFRALRLWGVGSGPELQGDPFAAGKR